VRRHPVFDSRSRFPKMKCAKILAVFGAFALLGAGSAVVLESFGTISGTADVKPALNFVEVQATNNSGGEYLLLENRADVKVNISDIRISDEESLDDLASTNSTDYASPDDYILVVVEGTEIVSYDGSKDFLKASTQDGGITGGLTDTGENLDLELEDTLINEFDYGEECDASQVEKPEGGCETPTFVVNSTK
jgi:hypothetical protein